MTPLPWFYLLVHIMMSIAKSLLSLLVLVLQLELVLVEMGSSGISQCLCTILEIMSDSYL